MILYLNSLLTKYRNWNARVSREYERSKPIVVTISIPYTEQNEINLRPVKVGDLMFGSVTLPVPLAGVQVRVTQNPNWRR